MSSLPFRATPAKEEPPPEFLCPITLDLMRDPVAAPTGITYDRAAIGSWLLSGGQRTCPVTHAELRAGDLVPNHTLRRLIQDWCAANHSGGRVDPVPATPEEAAVAEMEGATLAGDADRCAAAARWVRRQARLAEPNRGRLASAGAARALAAAFASFADAAGADATSDVLDAVLAALALVMPMDEESIVAVGSSSASVARLVAVAANGGLHSRLQSVVVIREIISLSCHRYGAGAVDLSANADAIVQVLVKTIRDAICPQATRACLVAAYHLACPGESAAARLAAAGLVPVLVELLVDADRSTAEKALAALDAALLSSDGRARARADALAVPVLVKKMFCVSDAATELVLSALLRMCKKCPEDDMDGTAAAGRRLAIIESLQVGALQKVLLLLQAGCREETKEKATELLRVIVRYQGRVECVDTMDFRGLKRGTTILTT
ncbi:hypothetical protein PAHAL_9G316200 [Panicum hallii]|jgi:hypothetical protein|uniref:U-box domain-containing protein n=1 Tax=Panicum hallii TaxID=206008 RepID=A0A2S3IMM5_9POAL|nr:U-box domain-containing protein 21-like [Panicum hallii]PAN47669.1 hypothetical protein PAHAL_9G316200 [Panicum hallii]